MKRLFVSIVLCISSTQAATYYVDSKSGLDAADGVSEATPWKSIDRVNRATFSPGDSLLLHAGSAWQEVTLQPRGSGSPSRPIVLGKYGSGSDPLLAGSGKVPCVLRLENQQGWEISDLEITNHADHDGERLRGVEIHAADSGRLEHLHFHNLYIHDINGASSYLNDSDNVAKSFGGFVSLIEGSSTQTFWTDFVVDHCRFVDDGPAGLTMFSTWISGHRTNDPSSWAPSLGVIIRSCVFQRISRNGLVVRACVAPLIEHNLFDHCGLTGSGNASFAFQCDDALFQYNEACFTKYNPGDADAAGFDSDYNCRRTVFQYNYSHDNDYGFILVCCNGRAGFNEGTIVRNNISQNDGGVVFRIAGPARGTRFYNNTVLTAAGMKNPKEGSIEPYIVAHKTWNGWSDDTEFSANVIINQCASAAYEFGRSTVNRYSHNLYFGIHPANEPDDRQKLRMDPLLAHPGEGNTTITDSDADLRSAFAAYRLPANSPAKGLGAALPPGP